eukprot:1139688-Pelagomonas_calceolata.AAC.4
MVCLTCELSSAKWEAFISDMDPRHSSSSSLRDLQLLIRSEMRVGPYTLKHQEAQGQGMQAEPKFKSNRTSSMSGVSVHTGYCHAHTMQAHTGQPPSNTPLLAGMHMHIARERTHTNALVRRFTVCLHCPTLTPAAAAVVGACGAVLPPMGVEPTGQEGGEGGVPACTVCLGVWETKADGSEGAVCPGCLVVIEQQGLPPMCQIHTVLRPHCCQDVHQEVHPPEGGQHCAEDVAQGRLARLTAAVLQALLLLLPQVPLHEVGDRHWMTAHQAKLMPSASAAPQPCPAASAHAQMLHELEQHHAARLPGARHGPLASLRQNPSSLALGRWPARSLLVQFSSFLWAEPQLAVLGLSHWGSWGLCKGGPAGQTQSAQILILLQGGRGDAVPDQARQCLATRPALQPLLLLTVVQSHAATD